MRARPKFCSYIVVSGIFVVAMRHDELRCIDNADATWLRTFIRFPSIQ